jgi:multiple antibiotic resistance protein
VSAVAFFTLCFPSLFSIVDPTRVPVSRAGGHRAARQAEADRGPRGAHRALVLGLFAATGTAIFRFFGIHVPAFKVMGGILLFSMALG